MKLTKISQNNRVCSVKIAIVYSIVFSLLAIFFRILSGNKLSILIVGTIGAVLGALIGFMISIIMLSQETRSFLGISRNAPNESELLLIILFTIISWQLLKYLLGDTIVIKIAGLIIGFYLGLKIIKFFRKRKSKK